MRAFVLYDARHIIVVAVVVVIRFTRKNHNNTRQHSTHQQWYLFWPKLPSNQYNNRQPIVRIYIVSGEISRHTHTHTLVCVQTLFGVSA